MLLYQDASNRYLALPEELRFSATNGYRACYGGKPVPRIICEAFVRESGGWLLDSIS